MPPTDEPGRRYRAPRHGGVDPRWGGPSEADPGDDPYGEPTGERVRAGGRHGAADERTDRPDDARRAPAWGRHGHDAPDAADGRRPATEWPPPTALPSGPPRDGRHPGPTPTFGRGPGQAPPSPPHGQSRPYPPSPPYGQRPPSPPYGQPPANGQAANGYGAPRPAGPPTNGHTPSGRFGAVPEQHPGRPTPTATQPPVAEEPSARADVPLLAGGTPPPGRTGESPTTADPDAESAVTETTGLGPNTGKHRRGGAGATSGPGRDEDADDRSGPGRRRDKDTGKASGKKKRKGSFWRELPLLVVVAIVLTFVIQTFIARIYVIPSASMEQTLHGCTGCANDRVAVDKVSYRFTDPAPGDVVVFRGPPAWLDNDEVGQTEPSGNPLVRGFQEALSLVGLAAPNEKDFVKRVIAVGGQTVACCDPQNRVLVDGRPLDEPYLYYQDGLGAQQATFDPVQVPQGQLWVMGDNRNNSADARFHGPVPTSDIIGKARVVVLPITRWRTVPAIDPQATTTALGSPTGLPEGGAAVAGALLAVPLARSARRLRRAAPAVTSAAPAAPGTRSRRRAGRGDTAVTTARPRRGGDGLSRSTGQPSGGRPPRRARKPLPPRTGIQPPRAIVRRSSEAWALQSALERHGLGPVVGVDEAGRGACAGPLAVAACILRPNDAKRFEGLTDSKLLPAAERERLAAVIRRRAVDFHVVLVDPVEVDRRGVHAANIDGMRRAVAHLDVRPGYVLTDGFPVTGFGIPSLAVPKGDLAAACVAAASILAKTTRDHLMAELHERRPEYGFDLHKGYCTPTHTAALAEHGPSPDHRYSFVNVAGAARLVGVPDGRLTVASTVGQNEVLEEHPEAEGGEAP